MFLTLVFSLMGCDDFVWVEYWLGIAIHDVSPVGLHPEELLAAFTDIIEVSLMHTLYVEHEVWQSFDCLCTPAALELILQDSTLAAVHLQLGFIGELLHADEAAMLRYAMLLQMLLLLFLRNAGLMAGHAVR